MWNTVLVDKSSTFCGNSWKKMEQLLIERKKNREFELVLEENPEEKLDLYSREKLIFLTAREDAACVAKEKGIPVIGYEEPEGEQVWSAQMVLYQMEDTAIRLLDHVYQREYHMPWTIAESKRCQIREMTLEDLDELYVLYQGKSIRQFMEPLYERDEEEEYTKAYIANMYHYYGYGMWLVFEKGTGILIGRAGLNNLTWNGNMILELGYAIAEEKQHMGYGTEVCQAIIEYTKEVDFGFDKLYCFIEPENKISIKLAEKLGFLGKVHVLRDGVPMIKYELDLTETEKGVTI